MHTYKWYYYEFFIAQSISFCSASVASEYSIFESSLYQFSLLFFIFFCNVLTVEDISHCRFVIQGRLKSGILTRYACATKTNALGYEKIIVISFVGMQKLWISAKFHERGSKNIACHAHWSFDLLWPITLLIFEVETCPSGFKLLRWILKNDV